ncbi:MAG: YncE family protein [Deltaproteobacteria bacterium]|nr:YncE family protein [Deltaproteobacteria bacterium]
MRVLSLFPRILVALTLGAVMALSGTACDEAPADFSGEGGIFDSPVSAVINGDYVYILSANFDLSDEGDGAITIVDIKRSLVNRREGIVNRVSMPAYIGKMVISEDGQTGYLANRAGSSILLVDLSDPVRPELIDLNPDQGGTQGIRVGSEPFGLTLSPDETRLFVANVGSGDLSIVDVPGRQLIKNELLNWGLNDIGIQPGSPYAYITNKGLNAVAIYDITTSRFVTSFPLGGLTTGLGTDTRGIDFTSDGRWAFIAARNPESLLVVDTDKIPAQVDTAVVDILPMDLKPTAVRVAPNDYEVWVTNFDSHNVYAIDIRSRSVLDVVSTGAGPYDLAIADLDPDAPEQYYVFVSNFNSHNVSLIDGRTKEYVWVIP